MRLYAAVSGVKTINTGLRTALKCGFRDALISFETGRTNALETIMEARRSGAGVFLDSGAFSAFNSGAHIDLDAYCDFVLAVRPLLAEAANLDVIGDDEGTRHNFKVMTERGCDPLATCHFGQDPKEILDTFAVTRRGALGGMAMKASLNRAMRQRWLDTVFDVLHASSSWPIRVHGYGMSDTALMERYPWFSVDSTTWASAARFGNELLPDGRFLTQRKSPIGHERGMSADLARIHRYGPRMVKFAEYCTRLWEQRGVKWDS